MKAESVRDFFYKYVNIVSSLSSSDFKLTPREVDFLVLCALYNYEGGDLTDTKTMRQYFLDIKFFNRRQDYSVYKYKIGIKRWAITGTKKFQLLGVLNTKKGDDLAFNFNVSYKDEEFSDRQDIK